MVTAEHGSEGMVEGGGVFTGENEQRKRENRGQFEGVHVQFGCLDRVDMYNVQVLNEKSSGTNRNSLTAVG
jgi:hypothetical protein